jgi:hypothetical protein
MSDVDCGRERDGSLKHAGSGDESESARLRLDSANDTLNFASHGIKRANDLLAAQSIDVAECYLDGQIHLILKCFRSSNAEVFDLVFRRVPAAISHLDAACLDVGMAHRYLIGQGYCRNWDEHAMRVGISYTVKTPEKEIPSLVWAERSQERSDFRRVPSQTTAVQPTFDSGAVFSEGEPSVIRGAAGDQYSGRIDGMIQGVAEIASGVLDDCSEPPGDWCNAELVHIIASVRVMLDNGGVWFTVDPSLNSVYSGLYMFAAAVD